MSRLSVNITPSTEAALRLVAEREGVSMTEALRRLVGYGELVYRADQIDGAEIIVRTRRAQERLVLLGYDPPAGPES